MATHARQREDIGLDAGATRWIGSSECEDDRRKSGIALVGRTLGHHAVDVYSPPAATGCDC
jgi:hypothetical protein